MATKKMGDLPNSCRSPEHNPPHHVSLPNGVYEHTCPKCGAKQVFTVARPTW
jgi:hypothetical protein